ncbi:SPOR domain-containing protein [Piscinibacter sp.]|uniref:SPOR domain-containing protein n=1 Tax=Piscinibacter sp. TaxID=1903157 RepID=UPI002CFF48F8|nr:SPOR domain-containing protein [Albitalea sp.]HUG22766.1 SPOR domain-containing protein [Albitalea sp.]
MGLLSIFQRKSGGNAKASAAGVPPDSVQEARTRARRRLIGAVVLVVIGVIGFPLLFETQPRSIPVDIPIVIPARDAAPPLAMPAPRPAPPVAAAPEVPASAAAAADVVTETQAEAGRELPPPDKPPAPVVKTPEAPSPKPAAVAARPAPAPTATVSEGKRAQALLEGKTAAKEAPKDAGRYVVQVGAFADSQAAQQTRLRIEKLGLKTYTQVAETASGSRVRVRVGPFGSREEADRAMAKIKASGSPAVVLTL